MASRSEWASKSAFPITRLWRVMLDIRDLESILCTNFSVLPPSSLLMSWICAGISRLCTSAVLTN